MHTFVELREKLRLKSGEKMINKIGKQGKQELSITKKGREFNLYIDNELADTFKSEKEARKAQQEVGKLIGVKWNL